MRGREDEEDEEHREADGEVLRDLARIEAVDFLQVGVERRRDAVAAKEGDVPDEQSRGDRRQDAHVERVEMREREVPVLGASDEDALQMAADEGYRPHDAGGDARGPVPFLIPREQIACQGEPEGDAQERQAKVPVELAGPAVCAVKGCLNQMRREEDDHRLGAEMVEPADEPAAGDTVADVGCAGPGRGGAGRIGAHQEPAGDRLNDEREGERAPPDIGPARAAGHGLCEYGTYERAVAGALVEPVAEAAHAETSRRSAIPW